MKIRETLIIAATFVIVSLAFLVMDLIDLVPSFSVTKITIYAIIFSLLSFTFYIKNKKHDKRKTR